MGKKKKTGPSEGPQVPPAAEGSSGDAGTRQTRGEALHRRTELLKAFLQQQAEEAAAEAEAAEPGEAAVGSSDAGSDADGGEAPAGGAPPLGSGGPVLDAFLARLAKAAPLRVVDIKGALRSVQQELGAAKAKRLEQLERELTKHRAPLVYQSLDAAAGRGGKKGAPAVFADAAKFDDHLTHLFDTREIGGLMANEEHLAGSIAASLFPMQRQLLRETGVFPARILLFDKRLPEPDRAALRGAGSSAGRAPAVPATPGGRDEKQPGFVSDALEAILRAASLAALRMQRKAQLLEMRRQLASTGLGMALAGLEAEEEAEGQPRWPLTCKEGVNEHLWALSEAVDAADAALDSVDPSLHYFRYQGHAAGCMQDLKAYPKLDWFVSAALRGHALMTLEEAAARLPPGNTPQLQALARPLQLFLDRPRVTADDLAELACLQAGAPHWVSFLQQLSAVLRQPVVPDHLLASRAVLLLSWLLAAEPGLEAPTPAAAWEEDELGDTYFYQAGPALLQGMQAGLPEVALRLVARRRALAARLLTAVHRLEARHRLSHTAAEVLMTQLQLSTKEWTLEKVAALDVDDLLGAYAYVAVQMGLAFQTPEDLGATPGGPNFSAACGMAGGGLSWAPPERGQTGGQLAVNALAMQLAMHQAPTGEGEASAAPPHCLHSWCPPCGTFPEPNAGPKTLAEAAARLVEGVAAMPGAAAAAEAEQRSTKQWAAARFGGAFAGDAEAHVSRVPLRLDKAQLAVQMLQALRGCLCFLRINLHNTWTRLDKDRLVHAAVALEQGATLPGNLNFAELSVAAAVVADVERRIVGMKILLEELAFSMDGPRAAIADSMRGMLESSEEEDAQGWIEIAVESLQHGPRAVEALRKERQKLELKPAQLCPWAMHLSIALKLAAAAQERAGGGGAPFAAPPASRAKLAGFGIQLALQGRAFRAVCLSYKAAEELAHFRSLDLVSQLRQACTLQLLEPFEGPLVAHVLRPQLLAAGERQAGVAACDADATVASQAEALLAEEAEAEAKQKAAAAAKQEKQRQAEQRRLQQAEEERQRRQREAAEAEEQRRERERQRQEEEQREEEQRQDELAQTEQYNMLLRLAAGGEMQGGDATPEAPTAPAGAAGVSPPTRAQRAGHPAPPAKQQAPQPGRKQEAPPAAAPARPFSKRASSGSLKSEGSGPGGSSAHGAPTPENKPRILSVRRSPTPPAGEPAAAPAPVAAPAAPQQAAGKAAPAAAAPGGGGDVSPALAGRQLQAGSPEPAAPVPASQQQPGKAANDRPWADPAAAVRIAAEAAARHGRPTTPAEAPPAGGMAAHAAAPGSAARAPSKEAAAPQGGEPGQPLPGETAAAEVPAAVAAAAAAPAPAAGAGPEGAAAAGDAGRQEALAAAAAADECEQQGQQAQQGQQGPPTVARGPSPSEAAAAPPQPAAAPPAPAPLSWAAKAGALKAAALEAVPQQQQQHAAKPGAAVAAAPPAWPGLGSHGGKPARAATPSAAPLPLKPGWAALGKKGAAAAPEAAPAGLAPGVPVPPRVNWLAALSPDQAEVAALALPGLRNESGEFNCFLNVIVQCLWRCQAVREEIIGWAPDVYLSDGVLEALHGLIKNLSSMDQHRQQGGAAGGRPVIDPTPLREAINSLPGQEFKIGEMSDAGELLLVLYEHIAAVAPGRPAEGLEVALGLQVGEEVRCGTCGHVTHKQSYTQYFCNTSAAALRGSLRGGWAGGDPGLGGRLRKLEEEHQKTCDTDEGGCGTLNPVRHLLRGPPPAVFSLQLVWETHREQPYAIGNTMRAVAEEVDLGQLYEGVPPGTRYRLRSMVCYYGRHYQALVRLQELHERWVLFDDTSVSSVGDWSEVRRRCESGRVQPSVLFYEAQH